MIAERHIAIARSRRFLDPALPGLRGESPDRILMHLEEEVERLGTRLVAKKSDTMRATTWPNRIRMPRAYFGWPSDMRVRLLAHELVHSRQWRGIAGFGALYLTAGFRWAVEMQAHLEGLTCAWVQGWTDRRLRAWARDEATDMSEDYRLGRLGRGVADTTLELFIHHIERLMT